MTDMRKIGIAIALLALASAVLVFLATERIGQAAKSADQSREATFQTYRLAQSIKARIQAYELTINEYYSTALDLQEYQSRTQAIRKDIEREVNELAQLETGNAVAATDLKAALHEIESMRQELETALSGEHKDWDQAREVLYKLNVVSERAAQPSDVIAEAASKQSLDQGEVWRMQQSQARLELYIAMVLALVSGVLAVVPMFRKSAAGA